MKKLLLILTTLFLTNAYAQLGTTFLLITFEDNMGYFYEDYIKIDTSTSNIWQIGTPDKTIINYNGASFSNKGIVTDTSAPYPINVYSSFIFTIPVQFIGDDIINSIIKCGCDFTFMNFRGKYDTDTLSDGGTIQ